jgi:hypothetical protein
MKQLKIWKGKCAVDSSVDISKLVKARNAAGALFYNPASIQ